MKFIATGIMCFFAILSFGQNKSDIQKIDSLNDYSYRIINETDLAKRLKADSFFTKILVRSLKAPNSFNKSLDSLHYISILTSPDKRFRIFTWQLMVNENLTRQHGAIQMNTRNGELKLFPLIDKSDVTLNITDTIANHLGWMGAVYYKLIQNQFNNNTYYTLIGFDANNIRTEKKVIDVLYFDNEKPIFGGDFFAKDTSNQLLKNKPVARYVLEYKKFASPRLNFDSSLNLIVMEHLISESNEPSKKYTLVPDGDYEGFKWQNGKWVYIKKLFTEVTEEGAAPTPIPLNKNNGLFQN